MALTYPVKCAITVAIIAVIVFLYRKTYSERYQSWSRVLSTVKCRDNAFSEIDAVLMPAGSADPTPWFDYSHQYWDGRGYRSCDDCPGPSICPNCHNHGVSLEMGAAPPGPLALGADPSVYEYMHSSPTEHYGAHILSAGAISDIIGGVTNAVTTAVIDNHSAMTTAAKNIASGFIGGGSYGTGEKMTVGSDGGYVRGYGNICFGAPDDASPAAVADIISPAVRAASVGGVNRSGNVGYTVMEGYTPNYASSLDPDFITSREAMGACTARKPLSSSLPRTHSDGFDAMQENSADAAVERSLCRGVCNAVGPGAHKLGFIGRGASGKQTLDRTNGKLPDSAIDYLYKEATSMGLVDTRPAKDDCVFWGAYGRPYYEQC